MAPREYIHPPLPNIHRPPNPTSETEYNSHPTIAEYPPVSTHDGFIFLGRQLLHTFYPDTIYEILLTWQQLIAMNPTYMVHRTMDNLWQYLNDDHTCVWIRPGAHGKPEFLAACRILPWIPIPGGPPHKKAIETGFHHPCVEIASVTVNPHIVKRPEIHYGKVLVEHAVGLTRVEYPTIPYTVAVTRIDNGRGLHFFLERMGCLVVHRYDEQFPQHTNPYQFFVTDLGGRHLSQLAGESPLQEGMLDHKLLVSLNHIPSPAYFHDMK